jgi:hypothetical protein
MNVKLNNIGNDEENQRNITASVSSCQKLKSRISFIQLKPILDIFLRGFSLSTSPQHSLKALLLLNPMCPKKIM